MLFVDYYSREMWVYFLKQKSEVFLEFKKYKVMVEKEFGKTIKILCSDNGREFCSNDYVEFCKRGVQLQYTTLYNSKQNVVE